jgi:hypothetical protein
MKLSWRFGGTCRLFAFTLVSYLAYYSMLKMEARCSSKRPLVFNTLQGAIWQTTEFFITTGVRTSNSTSSIVFTRSRDRAPTQALSSRNHIAAARVRTQVSPVSCSQDPATVPQLRRLVAELPSRRPGFESRSGSIKFVLDKSVLGWIFSEYLAFPLHFSLHQLLHIFSLLKSTHCGFNSGSFSKQQKSWAR